MQQLLNNCRIGKMSVIPNNWDSPQADTSIDWLIHYRFYDDNLKKNKLIRLKGGINRFSTLLERQEAIKYLLEIEKGKIENHGFNPITGQYKGVNTNEVTENTAFDQALKYALEKAAIEKNTKAAISSSLNIFLDGVSRLNYRKLPLKEITKKHIFNVLENCGEVRKLEKKVWNSRYYNAVRSDIGILWRVFKKMGISEYNIPQKVETQKVEKKIRRTTNMAERKKIINRLNEKGLYTFKRFMMIFFYSGSRIIEIMQVKREDVDFEKMRFIIPCKKGRSGHRQEYRVINNKVLRYWKEIYNEADCGDYLFAKNLKPGKSAMRPEQINRRWKRHIKDKLNITADFYSLKHSYLDGLDEEYEIKLAQKAAGHASTRTTEIYTTGRKRRKNQFLIDAKIAFA